jgi:uncharacterized protein (DUF427 family)
VTQKQWVKAGPLVFEQSPRRVRAEIGGIAVADSTRVLWLWEEGKVLPLYLFPSDDVRTDLLRPSEHPLPEAHHGLASYSFTLEVDGRVAENAAWTYSAAPAPEGERLADYVAFGWGAMDAWYEEEQVLAHPRDPYQGVDTRESSRHVRVVLGGETVVDTDEAPIGLRGGPSYTLLHPARGHPDGPSDAERDPDFVRLQGGGVLLVGHGGRRGL